MNYKNGNGFRPNSDFESFNYYLFSEYKFNKNTTVSSEITYLKYLAHQAGGLSDKMFNTNPLQSNRERNWFGLNWLLYNIKLNHDFNLNTSLSLSFFGLDASRNALGFRTNRVDQIDSNQERDLIKGDFQNYGLESRFLKKYNLNHDTSQQFNLFTKM